MISRDLGADFARTLVELYAELERRIITALGIQLRRGIPAPHETQAQLEALATLRRQAEALLRRLDGDLDGYVEQALILAYARGASEGIAELARLASRDGGLSGLETSLARSRIGALRSAAGVLARLRWARARHKLDEAIRGLPGAEAIHTMAHSLATQLRGTHVRILRWQDDVYRHVIARTALPGVLAGTDTRLRSAQRALDDFLDRGVTGFVDKSGRNWELASYVEMAARTGAAQAAVQAALDRYREAGHDLVMVSDAPQECALCRPWEGKVLSITGHTAGYATVAHAVAAGLMHPNCRHFISLYQHGITKRLTHTEDPEGDEARRKLRYLERQVRRWKRREVGALTPEAKRHAAATVREYQRRIREHVAETGLIRQRHRERIGTAR